MFAIKLLLRKIKFEMIAMIFKLIIITMDKINYKKELDLIIRYNWIFNDYKNI